jgi:predicted nuclease of predicted toxin-antitoxin system
MTAADSDDRILITANTDFGELLANAPVLAPSVILLRRTEKTEQVHGIHLDHLPRQASVQVVAPIFPSGLP